MKITMNYTSAHTIRAGTHDPARHRPPGSAVQRARDTPSRRVELGGRCSGRYAVWSAPRAQIAGRTSLRMIEQVYSQLTAGAALASFFRHEVLQPPKLFAYGRERHTSPLRCLKRFKCRKRRCDTAIKLAPRQEPKPQLLFLPNPSPTIRTPTP